MTEEKLNGGVVGGKQEPANNEKQTDGVSNGGVDSANIELEEIKKASAGKDAKIAELASRLKEIEEAKKAEEMANKSIEEQLNMLKAEREADKKEKALIDSLTAKGLNVAEFKQATTKYESGDFEGYADILAKSMQRASDKASKQSVDEFKGKFESAKAPNLDNKTSGTEAELKARGLL